MKISQLFIAFSLFLSCNSLISTEVSNSTYENAKTEIDALVNMFQKEFGDNNAELIKKKNFFKLRENYNHNIGKYNEKYDPILNEIKQKYYNLLTNENYKKLDKYIAQAFQSIAFKVALKCTTHKRRINTKIQTNYLPTTTAKQRLQKQIRQKTIATYFIHKCAQCKKEEAKNNALDRCARCKNVHYCSKVCQRAHWKTHKPDCKPIESAEESKSKSESTKDSKVESAAEIASSETGEENTNTEEIIAESASEEYTYESAEVTASALDDVD